MQIPIMVYTIDLGTSRVINCAHNHNIDVQYWTINDAVEMAWLQSIGANAIMTDVPDLGAQVLNQPEKRGVAAVLLIIDRAPCKA